MIQHELIKAGLKVTKPTFDTDGADLLVVDNINEKHSRFLKIQCKGRAVKKTSNIKIHKQYVTDNLVLMAYIKFCNYPPTLYFFTYKNIINWRDSGYFYVLNFSNSKVFIDSLSGFKYSNDSVDTLTELLKESTIKKFSTLIVDEGFIHLAIKKGMETYKRIYPDRILNKPAVNEVIRSILSVYDNYQSADTMVHCHVFADENKHNSHEPSCIKLYTDDDIEIKIYRLYTRNSISSEILEYLERVINVENVMLAVDDYKYADHLNILKSKGIDVRIVQFASYDGRQVFTEHMWGDVIYAVAHAMGIGRTEW
ncbi:hypothetical protein D3C78_551670 [compost metagenome]